MAKEKINLILVQLSEMKEKAGAVQCWNAKAKNYAECPSDATPLAKRQIVSV